MSEGIEEDIEAIKNGYSPVSLLFTERADNIMNTVVYRNYSLLIGLSVALVLVSGCVQQDTETTGDEIHTDADGAEAGDTREAGIDLFNSDGVKLTFFWLGGHKWISNGESEISVSNDNNYDIVIEDSLIEYNVSGNRHAPMSGSWSAYRSLYDAEYYDYKQIYPVFPSNGLVLKPGEIGKLHYHYSLNEDFAGSGMQNVRIRVVFRYGAGLGKTETIELGLDREVKDFDITYDHVDTSSGSGNDTATDH